MRSKDARKRLARTSDKVMYSSVLYIDVGLLATFRFTAGSKITPMFCIFVFPLSVCLRF